MSEAETATETTEITETTTVETAEPADLSKEVEKWKALSKKNEERAKANAAAAKELEEVRRQSMTEMEAAIDKAKGEARAEVTQQFGARLATEAVRAAASGRVADVDALLEGIDPARFLGDDGEPNRDAISSWMDRIAPQVEERDDIVRTLDLGQGPRGAAATVADPLEKALTEISRR